MDFDKTLNDWYLRHKRELPWRDTDNPYFIWLSEIILQQTRVAQGLPYYLQFINVFPTVFDLASADEQQVLKLWQGLGYYSRARNLHKTAKYVAFELNGIFPDTYTSLLKLNGVGAYTAAAIASFSYGEPVAVVDGNVFRVLARYFDIETDIASPAARKEFTELAHELMPKNHPAMFNQAIMEFGAMQCVPKSPDCGVCPLQSGCLALKYGRVGQLPVKSKKAKPKNRYFHYLVLADELENTAIVKRTAKGIWHNLYEFPLIESENLPEPEVFKALVPENEILSVAELHSNAVSHKLTHQNLHIRFHKVTVGGTLNSGITAEELHGFPFPIVLFNFIEKHWN